MQKSIRKKRLTVLVISGIVALGLCLFFYFNSKDPNANIEITELVGKYNKNCPLVIQEGIRLDSVSLPEEKVVQYNLTLVNVDKATVEMELVKKNIEESLISTVKANPGLKVFRDNKFTLVYHYSDKEKRYLFAIRIAPAQYN